MKDRHSTKKVHVNGADFNYIEAGKGEPIVLVHGSLSDFRTWSLQIKFFSKHYHVIAYSRRYHYPNAPSVNGSAYSPTLHAEDLAGMIKALRLGAVHLIGSSYGAYASLIMAARHPDLVRTLVLGEPPVLPLLKKDFEGNILLSDFSTMTLEKSKKAFESDNLELGVKLFYTGVTSASFEKLSGSLRTGMLENAVAMKTEMTAPDCFPSIEKEDALLIQSPCLLVSGQLSPELFHRINHILETLLPRTEYVGIPEASHNMHSDNPKAYNETVLKFLLRYKV